MLKTIKQTRIKVVAIAVSMALLSVATPSAYAAGLGRITVQSALGQPLRAQLEVTATREELSSLSARLASADAFRLAGVEYASALGGLRFAKSIKEEGGRKFIEVTTERPLNEPFIDMLVELSWTSGRLVREYTFLLDPPGMMARVTPTTPPASESATAARATEAVSAETATRPVDSSPAAVATSPVRIDAPKPLPAKAVAGASSAVQSRETRAGDTLGKIAQEMRPEGVSLDQMLVALFRENQDAFDGNMNRLRVGKIIKVPDAGVIAAQDSKQARKEILAQARDFDAYRTGLAGKVGAGAGKDVRAGQESQGKVAPKVEETAAAKSGTDKLAVSRTETAKDAGKEGGKEPASATKAKLGALEEDLIARDRALKEANSRIADLEKNLNDLKKLAELKSQAASTMQKAAEATKPPTVAKAPEVPKPAEAQKPPEPVKAVAPEVATKPVTSAPEPAKAAGDTAAVAPTVAAPEVKPPPKKPVPVVAEEEEEEESGFIEENAPLLFAGGGLVALLAGYFGFAAYRRKRQEKSSDSEVPLTQAGGAENSVFDESASSSLAASTVAVSGSASVIDTTLEGGSATIDPLEEADTYLAFGKDSQAEEILLEALRADPRRLAVHLKLLEIYAGRRSTMQFNTLAEDLRQQTGGSGEEWDRAVEMGRVLDPNNALYQDTVEAEVEQAQSKAMDTEATMVFSAPPVMEAPPEQAPAVEPGNGLDFDLGLDEPAAAAGEPAAADSTVSDTEVAALDFDLDLGEPEAKPEVVAEESLVELEVPAVAAELSSPPPMDIDFDLELPETPKEEAVALALDVDLALPDAASSEPDAAPLSLSLELPDTKVEELPGTVEVSLDALEMPAVAAVESGDVAAGLDFDFDLGDAGDKPEEVPAAGSAPMELTLDSGGEAEEPAAQEEQATGADSGDMPDNPEAATKLELALAYEEMGDRDGARELFQEVLSEGSPSQQATARSKLEQLG